MWCYLSGEAAGEVWNWSLLWHLLQRWLFTQPGTQQTWCCGIIRLGFRTAALSSSSWRGEERLRLNYVVPKSLWLLRLSGSPAPLSPRREEAMLQGLKGAVSVPMAVIRKTNEIWPPLVELARVGNMNTMSDLQVGCYGYRDLQSACYRSRDLMSAWFRVALPKSW